MGLIAYTSQKYEILLNRWIANIVHEQRQLGPHESKVIIPNHRVANWLNREFARHVGVSMNIRFLYLESLLQQQSQSSKPETDGSASSQSLSLEWSGILWDYLKSEAENPDSNPFAKSQLSDDEASSDLQWLQLAWEFSSLLQTYAEHRPYWLHAWERDHSFQLPPNAHTYANSQKILYQRLVLDHNASRHPLTTLDFQTPSAAHGLENVDQPTQTPLHFFGFWNLSASKWQALEALAGSNPLQSHIYIPFPTENYVADVTRKALQQPLLLGEDGIKMSPNYQLLAKLGQRGRAMQMLLLDSATEADECFQSEAIPSNGISRLVALQAQLTTPESFDTAELPELPPVNEDFSIQIHSVWNHRREIEVAKAMIQQALTMHPDLSLESIHVCAPDISVYTGAIAEVFGEEKEDQALAFSIQNSVEAEQITGIRVVMDFFKLLQSDWKVADVLNWLSNKPVSEAFALSLQEIELIKHWLECAGIIFGNPNSFSSSSLNGEAPPHSWEHGMHQLMQAYAGELPVDSLGKTGFDRDPPHQHLETFGKLCELYEFMKQAGQLLALHSYDSEYFRYHCTRIIQRILPSENEFEKQVLLSTINRIVEDFQTPTIDLGCFSYLLRKTLPRLPLPQTLSRKTGIQFSSIQSEDMTPCRVRILLGMNEADFPAVDVPQSHNLLQYSEAEPNDPSRKEDQRYWMLQSLHQTSEQWIAIYQEQDASGNASRLLSPAVEAVVDAVDHFSNEPVPRFQHPRFEYDDEYFSGDGAVRHFSQKNYQIAIHLNQPAGEPSAEPTEPPAEPNAQRSTEAPFSIWDLAAFFTHPNKWVCENRLGIRFPKTKDFSQEHEPLIWLGLSGSYGLKTDLLQAKAKQFQDSDIKKILGTHHFLLDESIETLGVDATIAKVKSIPKLAKDPEVRLLQTIEMELSSTSFKLSDEEEIALTHAVFVDPPSAEIPLATIRASDLKSTHNLEAWVHMLAFWMHLEPSQRPVFKLIGSDTIRPIYPPDNPKGILQDLIEIFINYNHQAVPFFPSTSERIANESDTIEVIDQSAQWQGQRGEKYDPYNEFMFRNQSPFDETFEQLANQVLNPLLICLPKSKTNQKGVKA